MTQTNTNKITSLYERDYVAWADEQALLLEQERFSELDLIHLIEEVKDLGRRERDAIESQLIRLFLHLIKWQYQPDKRSSSWEISIKDARRQIARLRKKYPVLTKHLYSENVLYECYSYAVEEAADETKIPLQNLPLDNPYSIEDVLNPDFFPQLNVEPADSNNY